MTLSGHSAKRLFSPGNSMYRAFYNIIRLEEEVPSKDAHEVELADVYSNIFPLMKEDREFFGLIDSQGTVLQAMYDEDADQYWFEIPRPDLQGSYGASLSFDVAMDLLRSLDGLFPTEGFDGFEFSQWIEPKPVTHPGAVDPATVGSYPASVNSGGGYFYDEVLEYRVWVHAPVDGSDWFKAFASYEEALEYADKTEHAERPLALIRQREYIDEPKPGELHHIKDERIAEWRVEWLADGPRKPGDIEEFMASQNAE